jgi:hypothetical protein
MRAPEALIGALMASQISACLRSLKGEGKLPGMRHQQPMPTRLATLTAIAVSALLGACSVNQLSEMVPKAPSISNFDWNPYSRASSYVAPLTQAKATAADYVNADGTCVGAPPAAETTAEAGGTTDGAPPTTETAAGADGTTDGAATGGVTAEVPAVEQLPPRVALQMTECAVISSLGPPEKIDIGANERGDRSVTMLYSTGERPGLYRFTAGLLTLIERVEPPPPPPKPPKPQKPAKPRRSVT